MLVPKPLISAKTKLALNSRSNSTYNFVISFELNQYFRSTAGIIIMNVIQSTINSFVNEIIHIRARQNIIVRIYIFSQKMRRYFFAILSQKNIFWRKDILKYLLGNYLFKSENIFEKCFIVNRGKNIYPTNRLIGPYY